MGHIVSRNVGSIKKSFNMAVVLENSMSLTESLQHVSDITTKKKLIHNYLTKVALPNSSNLTIKDFNPEQEWMNTTEPLSFKNHLKNKVVILDFFTYCCINCMHILPELKEIEQKFSVEQGLVVVGVHYAKFSNEKLSSNIEAAVHRYEIHHPVVNDESGHMWNELDVNCWPTFVVLAPGAIPVLHLQGEGNKELLMLFTEVLINIMKEKKILSDHSIPEIKVTSSLIGLGPLKYPGKVTTKYDLLAISDTSYHRIIISDLDGNVQHVIGGKENGFKDGNFEETRFHSPQGLAFVNENILYVADTENHSIREIDLQNKKVKTVAGTCVQGHDYIGGKQGTTQPISSPWDVCFADNEDILYIAMAGTHQIWALFLKDSEWWKNKRYKAGTCVAIVGSGREENKNNDYPSSAGLAQPSGLAYSMSFNCLFFADSESSAIRSVNLTSGKVSGVVGGALDPRNLFAFDDKDGVGLEAKLQHPLGIAWSSKKNKVYVADSYNHKIKEVEPHKRSCKALPISIKLNEPGGLCAKEEHLYVADTNNHLIRKVDLNDYSVEIINIKIPKSNDTKSQLLSKQKNNSNSIINKIFNINSVGGDVNIKLSLNLPNNTKISTDGAPSKWTVELPENVKFTSDFKDVDFKSEKDLNIKIPGGAINDVISLFVKCKVYICTDIACIPKYYEFKIDLKYDGDKQHNKNKHVLEHMVEV